MTYLLYLLRANQFDCKCRSIILHCSKCGILFLSSKSNQGRNDIFCSFGCRDIHKREKAKARSKRYYATEKGKERKRQLNRKRNMVPDSPSSEEATSTDSKSPIKKIEFFSHYARLFLSILLHQKIKPKEIAYFLQKVRSRALHFCKGLRHLDAYD